MANPQIEKGHTRIANEILNEIMKMNLNGTQFRLLIAIWRYTYGYRRKNYEMSLTFLSELINANRTQVDRELSTLIEKNIVKVLMTSKKGARVLQFNKNYDEWGKQSLESMPDPKPPKKSNVKPKYDEDNSYYKMAKYFHEKISVVAKDAGVEHLIKKYNFQTSADEFRKLIELDGVKKKQFKEVVDWVTQDDFWKTNILSAKKLRQKFMELAIKMNADKQPRTKQKEMQKDSRDKEIALQKWIAEGNDPDAFNWSD